MPSDAVFLVIAVLPVLCCLLGVAAVVLIKCYVQRARQAQNVVDVERGKLIAECEELSLVNGCLVNSDRRASNKSAALSRPNKSDPSPSQAICYSVQYKGAQYLAAGSSSQTCALISSATPSSQPSGPGVGSLVLVPSSRARKLRLHWVNEDILLCSGKILDGTQVGCSTAEVDLGLEQGFCSNQRSEDLCVSQCASLTADQPQRTVKERHEFGNAHVPHEETCEEVQPAKENKSVNEQVDNHKRDGIDLKDKDGVEMQCVDVATSFTVSAKEPENAEANSSNVPATELEAPHATEILTAKAPEDVAGDDLWQSEPSDDDASLFDSLELLEEEVDQGALFKPDHEQLESQPKFTSDPPPFSEREPWPEELEDDHSEASTDVDSLEAECQRLHSVAFSC